MGTHPANVIATEIPRCGIAVPNRPYLVRLVVFEPSNPGRRAQRVLAFAQVVSDDGRGVDTALRDKLVATNRWSQARAQLATDNDVLDALGTGVSVRGDADELAGRGIGLDLVRQTVARLGGEVKVSSVAGRGTNFSLRLPLSTSLAQAMLFKVGGQVYGKRCVNYTWRGRGPAS